MPNLDEIMTNSGFYGIRTRLMDYLNHRDLEVLCEIWSEDDSLKRTKWIKFMNEASEINVHDWSDEEVEGENVRAHIPGWDQAVKKVGANASLEDLQEIKESLTRLLDKLWDGFYPVHLLANHGATKAMKLIFETTFDLNSGDHAGWTPFHYACQGNIDIDKERKWEVIELLLRSSKERGIDLNLTNISYGETAFHVVCFEGEPGTTKLLLDNYKEYGIDIKKRNKEGKTALDLLRKCLYSGREHQDAINANIRTMEEEYAKIGAYEPTT